MIKLFKQMMKNPFERIDVSHLENFINLENIKSKANSTEYVRSLLFTKKEIGIVKLLELLPFIEAAPNASSQNQRLKAIYMKVFPVFFSYSELSKTFIQESINLIAKIKRHPFFAREKSLFDGWQVRLKTLLPTHIENSKELKDNENRFINIPGTDRYDVIGYAELDLFFRYHKWLKYHKLHKYLYFFANLSYLEIENINANNILEYEDKVNLYPMTTGARNAILRKLSELKVRSQRLETFSKMDYYVNTSKIEKSITEIKTILKTPIRKNHVYCENNLPSLLNNAIETVIFAVLRLPKEESLKVHEGALSLLKMAWGCHFFDQETKKNFNVLQTALNSKMKSFNKRRPVQKDVNNNHIYINNPGIYTVHFVDIESGIRSITYYLENVLLREF